MTIEAILSNLVTILTTVLASGAFWTYLSKKHDKKDAKTQLLVGIAHDRIIYLGQTYIARGSITKDEYENLYDYLFVPYKECGGNGTAARIMRQVEQLPIKS
jgi:hypothetical protein